MSDSSPSNNLGSFNFMHFMRFLSENNVLAISVAAVMSDRINDLTNTCVDSLLMPIINIDADNDGVRDIKSLEDKEIKIYGMKFAVGKVMIAIIRFIIITYVVFIISRLMNDISKRGKFKL